MMFDKGGNLRMAVKVLIPTPLRQFTGKQASIECNAATVGEALGSLTGSFAELRKHLYTEEGKIRSFVNVYLNDEDIRFLDKENTQTKDGDTISIVPSIRRVDRAEVEGIGERPWQFRPARYR